jgi:hypothetical protein
MSGRDASGWFAAVCAASDDDTCRDRSGVRRGWRAVIAAGVEGRPQAVESR